jgi:predicted nucleic acid-binding protein
MAAKRPRICWDSCSWISLIEGTPGRVEGLRRVAQAAERGEIELITSFLAMAETAKAHGTPSSPADMATLEQIRAAFEADYLIPVLVDRSIAYLAQELLRQHKLSGADGVHLATALTHHADELHTWDKKLLNLDSVFPGLRIRHADWTVQHELLPPGE